MSNFRLLIVFILYQSVAFSQTTFKGIVKDAQTHFPIEFCSIIQQKTTNGTLTNEKGMFTITIDVLPTYLQIHAAGYIADSLIITASTSSQIILLQPINATLEGVVVTGSTRATSIKENPIAILAVTTKQLDRAVENNIVDALVKNVPGLNVVKTGPNISKPFIHGLGYNRVLTLYDGIRQEGQQYGDEHGLEVDDYNMDKAEVIKGPASLLYGSDAIAGVVSLFPAIPRQNDGLLHGKFTSEYQTNNGLIGNGLRLNYAKNSWLFALRGSYKMAKNYQNPVDGKVYLTNFNVGNFSALVGHQSKHGYTHLNFTLYDNHQGIPDGSRDSLTRQFTKQVFEGDQDDITNRPILTEKELNSYKTPDLAQHIQHYRVYAHSFYRVGDGNIDALLGVQQNRRREYTHPSLPKQAGMYMQLNTMNYGFRYNAPDFSNISISVGINGMVQQNKNKDATTFPIPDYQLLDGGAYLYAKWKLNKWSISGGLRYDWRYIRWNDFYVGTNPTTGFGQQVAAKSSAYLQFQAYEKLFQGMSGSVGATYQPTEHISLKANVGRAYRSPNATEIGSNGLDPGAHIVYLGNRNFKPEFSLQEDIGIQLDFPHFSASAGLFNNNIQNYIYMSSVADENGTIVVDAQGNKTYQYQQSKAHLLGTDVGLNVHPAPLKGMQWNSSLTLVYGFNKNSQFNGKGVFGEYLPLIPPLTIRSNLAYEWTIKAKKSIKITPSIEVEFSAKQYRYLSLNGTETYTSDYTLLHTGVNVEFFYKPEHSIQLIVQANNVLNRAYQSHLSRLKYFEYYSQSPNNRSGIYNMGRNLSVKLIVSF